MCAGWSLVIRLMLDAIADAATAPGADDMVIFEGADAAATVKVPKVEVATTSGDKSYYAYWVEDQGVKADLAWNEGSFTDAERASRRHAVSPLHRVWITGFLVGPLPVA